MYNPECEMKYDWLGDSKNGMICTVCKEYYPISQFDPAETVDHWNTSSVRSRRPNFKDKYFANVNDYVDVETIDNITTLNEVCDADHTASDSNSNELNQDVKVLEAMEIMEAKID